VKLITNNFISLSVTHGTLVCTVDRSWAYYTCLTLWSQRLLGMMFGLGSNDIVTGATTLEWWSL